MAGSPADPVLRRSCFVLGDWLFYSFLDTDRHRLHRVVYDLRSARLLYHGKQEPLLQAGGRTVRAWPVFVQGRDA